MPNRINVAMTQEYTERFGAAPDCVAVDYRSLSVAELSEFRKLAAEKGIEMFVIKNSLAQRVFASGVEEGAEGLASVLVGQTALLSGGEGLPDIARLVDKYNKQTGKMAVRGGVFEKQVVAAADVLKFKDIPDRPTLLSQTLSAIISPMTGILGAVNSLLSAPASLTDAWIRKQEEGGES